MGGTSSVIHGSYQMQLAEINPTAFSLQSAGHGSITTTNGNSLSLTNSSGGYSFVGSGYSAKSSVMRASDITKSFLKSKPVSESKAISMSAADIKRLKS